MAEVKCLLGEAADISRHEPAIITADRSLLHHELEERAIRPWILLVPVDVEADYEFFPGHSLFYRPTRSSVW